MFEKLLGSLLYTEDNNTHQCRELQNKEISIYKILMDIFKQLPD